MDIFLAIAALPILLFGFVVFFGAPYLPTHTEQANKAIELLNLKKGQRLLELGAGDGKIALLALRKGLKVTAIELNPLLCVVLWVRTRRYRKQIKIICGNFWHVTWPEADGIYVFLLDKYMHRLDAKIKKRYETVKLVSYVFKIKSKPPTKTHGALTLYSYFGG